MQQGHCRIRTTVLSTANAFTGLIQKGNPLTCGRSREAGPIASGSASRGAARFGAGERLLARVAAPAATGIGRDTLSREPPTRPGAPRSCGDSSMPAWNRGIRLVEDLAGTRQGKNADQQLGGVGDEAQPGPDLHPPHRSAAPPGLAQRAPEAAVGGGGVMDGPVAPAHRRGETSASMAGRKLPGR